MNPTQFQIDKDLAAVRKKIELEPTSALEESLRLCEACEQIHYIFGLVEAHSLTSLAYWHLMDYIEGIKAVRQAAKYATQLDTDEKNAMISHLFALHYWGQAKYYTAQSYWIDSLEHATLNSQAEYEIEALIGLGNVWRITNSYDSAEETHQIALELSENKGIHWLAGKAAILLAWDRYLLHDYKGMLDTLSTAKRMLKAFPSPTWHAEISDFHALAYLGLNRLDEAAVASQEAIKIATENDLTWMVAHSSITHARIAFTNQEHALAKNLLESALHAAQYFDRGDLLSQICQLLSENAERAKDYKTALQYFREFRRYSADLLQDQSQNQGKDKAQASRRALNHRANKNIRRLTTSIENARTSTFKHYREQRDWLSVADKLFKSDSGDDYVILLIHASLKEQLSTLMGIAHSVCHENESITVLDRTTIALLVKETNRENTITLLSHFIEFYQWDNKEYGIPTIEPRDLQSFTQWWLGSALQSLDTQEVSPS
ncbi:hypothetical protein [Thaumasiovibrio subtropicus]|uniref:hypothetical protein n=1 Tax=Thaumasiovibrio subtropicus TaxID=1891207 RepID=UPI000B34E28A|nr:hypothetical protein [Thaumasiovibrio subtropicus]